MGWKETAQSLMNMLGANQRENARLRAEIEQLKNPVAPPAVTVPTTEVGQALIDEAIERSLRPLTPAGTNPWRVDQFLDDKYKIVTLEILEEILGRDTVHDLPYIPEFRDCDNYALRFMVSCYDQGYTGIAPHTLLGAATRLQRSVRPDAGRHSGVGSH